MNMRFILYELVVHIQDNDDLLGQLLEKGLLTITFLRLDEGRRRRVLDAILSEASRRGPDRLGIKEVAKTAGVPVKDPRQPQ